MITKYKNNEKTMYCFKLDCSYRNNVKHSEIKKINRHLISLNNRSEVKKKKKTELKPIFFIQG